MLEKTSYVVGAKKGLVSVFGDTGTGKSSLARLLHQKFLDQGWISVLLTNPNYPTQNSLLSTAPHKSLTGSAVRTSTRDQQQPLTELRGAVLSSSFQ